MARLGVPGFGASEGIHGLVQRGMPEWGMPMITTTQFPQPPGMGSSWNPDLVRKAGGVQGREARYVTHTAKYKHSVLMVWGPQADLARDPRWGRSEEVYGEDPFLAGVMATAFARGIQGNDPRYWQAAPLLKHFLANSNENGRMSSNSQFDERLFWEYYSVPFRMAFEEAGANAVMASYNAWNGTPMTLHPVLRDVLIGKWGVQVISSDGGAVQNLWEDCKVVPDQKAAVVAALKAGINQYLDKALDELRAALKEGLVTEAELDEAPAAEVPRLAEARPARPARDRPVHPGARGPGAVGRPGAPRRLEGDGPRVDRPAEERRRGASAPQGRAQVHRRHRPEGRQRALGLVRRHAAARDHAAAGHPRRRRPGSDRQLRPGRRGRGGREGGRGIRRGDRRGRQPPDLRPQHGTGVDERRRHRALRRSGRRARGP